MADQLCWVMVGLRRHVCPDLTHLVLAKLHIDEHLTLKSAVETKRMPIVTLVHQFLHSRSMITEDDMFDSKIAAIQIKNLEMYVFIVNKSQWSSFRSDCNFAAAVGDLPILQYIRKQTHAMDGWICDLLRTSVVHEHVHIVKWLLPFSKCQHDNLIQMAISSGNIELVDAFQSPRRKRFSIIQAAKGGHLEMIKSLHKRDMAELDALAIDAAASGGHLETVCWLHQHVTHGRCTTNAMDNAALHGHFDVVRFLHINRCEGCSTNAMDGAAKNGHLQIVRFLDKYRIEGCSTKALEYASSNGHLHVVVYLTERHLCSITESAINGAASNGHVEVLRHLVSVCPPISFDQAYKVAASRGHLPVVQLLFDKVGDLDVCHIACAHGHLHLLQWLYVRRKQNFCANLYDFAAEGGHLKILEWLHEQPVQADCSQNAMNLAAQNGHLTTIQWLHHHRTEGCSEMAATFAAQNGHLEVLEWLYDHYQINMEMALLTAELYDQDEIANWIRSL
jgi:hypothetical protein